MPDDAIDKQGVPKDSDHGSGVSPTRDPLSGPAPEPPQEIVANPHSSPLRAAASPLSLDPSAQPAHVVPIDAGDQAGTGPSTAAGKMWAVVNPKPGTTRSSALRELLETVVFVVVLVLLLKTFTAEAFVIPTGSMATTLLGYNKEVTCPKCGVRFPVNCSDEVENRQTGQPLRRCECFNCRYAIDFAAEEKKKTDDPSYSWKTPRTSSGDRVLVAKANNDTGLMAYKPLDVVVFKFPEGPQKNYVATNFIKRLIGLPEQIIGIYYGDIYVAEKKALLAALERRKDSLDDKEKLLLEPTAHEQTLDVRRRLFKNRFDRLLKEGDPCFRILRKPPAKIRSMKRPVYDNDHPATDLLEKHFPNRWAPEKDDPDVTEVTGNGYKDKRARAQKDAGSWQANNANGFTVAGRNDKETSWVRYRHVLRDTDGKPQLINDFMSYNTGDSSGAPSGGNRWVGDLLLECEVKVAAAEGELVFELSKGVDRFQARWALQTGLCTLLRNGKELASKTTRMSKPGTYQVGFANFDRRLTVWVNRGLVFGDGVDYKAPEGRDAEGTKHILHGPSAKNDLEPASIGSTGGAALAVHKLKLWRDSYYLSYSANSEDSVSTDIFLDPSRWQQEYTLEAMTMYVQPGHYLCLGDNSPASSDSRIWKKENESQTESGGLVPERLMLGRALVIYYPFYFPYPPFSSDENRVRIIE